MIRFGINATGHIVENFVKCARASGGVEIRAISSRSGRRAQEAAERFGIARWYASYGEMLDSGEIDAVYVCTPHNLHKRDILTALEHGKHVLCEKAMVLTAADAREVFDAAAREGLFVMEAMWPRFMPIYRQAREMIASGRIGRVNLIDACFCFMDSDSPRGRIMDPARAGGALYDVGVYCIEMASFFAGENPAGCHGFTTVTPSGVDGNNAIILQYPGGALATIQSGVAARTHNHITICGSEGRIHFPVFPWAEEFHVVDRNGNTERIELAEPYNFRGEIEEAARRMEAGDIQSPIMPHGDTIACAEQFDQLMADWFPEHK